MIILIVILSLVLVGATICAVCKPGEKDGICKYGYMEDGNK